MKTNKLLYCPECHEHRMHQLIETVVTVPCDNAQDITESVKWMCRYCDNVQVVIPEGLGVIRNTMPQFVESICKKLAESEGK